MRITNKKKIVPFTYSTGDQVLSEVEHYKYLGLLITNKLSWNTHLDNVVANALRKLFFLRRTLMLATPQVRLLAYKSIIRPMLEYAVIIWDPYTKSNIEKVERIQKKALRFIYNSYGCSSISELVKKVICHLLLKETVFVG